MVHPWTVFYPEVNYTTLAHAGTGSASTLAWAAEMAAQAAHLESIAAASTASGGHLWCGLVGGGRGVVGGSTGRVER